MKKPVSEEEKEDEALVPGLLPENQDFLRQIKWAELFSKKEDNLKQIELERQKWLKDIEKLNDDIVAKDIKLY